MDIDPSDSMIPVSDAPVNALFVRPSSTANGEASSSKPVQKGKKKNRKMKRYLPEPYSPADVTYRDVRDFLGAEYVDEVLARGDESEWAAPEGLELWSMVELTAGAFTVSGKSTLHFTRDV
jgi:tRNA (uracil-5-)-methyltransferase